MNKKLIALGIAGLGALAIIGSQSTLAATTIGTVTGKDGDVKDKVSMNAEVTAVNGSHLSIKDTETGKTYETAVGPSWHSGTYTAGQSVTIEGVETTGDNSNGHTFQATKINDKTLRDSFEGRPAWAGQGRGDGQGTGAGNHGANRGQNQSGNFVDANGDGKCDNL